MQQKTIELGLKSRKDQYKFISISISTEILRYAEFQVRLYILVRKYVMHMVVTDCLLSLLRGWV